MREILRQLCFLGTLLGHEAVGKRGGTQAELGKTAKELSKEEPSRTREPHVQGGAVGRTACSGTKGSPRSSSDAVRYGSCEPHRVCRNGDGSKCKIYANLEDLV